MPERTGDFNGLWRYPLGFPSMDTKVNPLAIELPQLVEAVGLDGRFLGALRPFPGMGDDTIHGVPKPEVDVTTIEVINNIIFAKYAAIQKGQSNDTLKGLVYLADNQAGTGQALYFAYRDSSDGSQDVVMLEDFNVWGDFKISTINEYDVTSLGKYIYFVASATTTSTVSTFQNREPPYNKAYFWDFKINDWDNFVVDGFGQRFMSIMPRRVLGSSLNEPATAIHSFESSHLFFNGAYGPSGHNPTAAMGGIYTYGAELVSRKHGLRSLLRIHTDRLIVAPNYALQYDFNTLSQPTGNTSGSPNQISSAGHNGTHLIHWGIPHFDGYRLWRTPVNDLGTTYSEYTPVGLLYLVDEYIPHNFFQTGSGIVSRDIDHDTILGTSFGFAKSTWYEDGGLVYQTQYNPFIHDFNPAPRFKRIAAYDNLLVGITDIEQPATIDEKEWENYERVPEALVWSSLTTPEPENFPQDQQYPVDDPAEKFWSLIAAGDFLFGITNSSIYRAARSGSQIVVNRMVFKLGGVSRFAATGVGSTLYVVTASGLKVIDGNTGAVQSVTALDRVILDDSEWASTLTSVHLEFDAALGCLILLNTSKQEAYLLWESTGAVTKLEDVPWVFLTGGPDPLTDGPSRAYFVTATGQVHVMDGAREMGKRSMCGTAAGETLNGTASGGTTTTLVDSGAVFPANCVGFKVYFLSGANEGGESIITIRNSDSQITFFPALAATVAETDRFSISPVITRLTLPVLQGEGGQVDPFVRKIVTSLRASFSDLAGETTANDVNGFFRMGIKEQSTVLATSEVAFNSVPDKTSVYVNVASTRPFPYFEFKGANQDWELQGALVKGTLGISEAQSRQG